MGSRASISGKFAGWVGSIVGLMTLRLLPEQDRRVRRSREHGGLSGVCFAAVPCLPTGPCVRVVLGVWETPCAQRSASTLMTAMGSWTTQYKLGKSAPGRSSTRLAG